MGDSFRIMATGFILKPTSRRVIKKLIGLDNLTKQGIRQGMFDSGHGLIKSASTEILRKPKSGHTYIILDKRGRRRRHVASAPGETHANFTGAARRSLSFQIQGVSSFEFGYGVSAGKNAPDYVAELEETRPSLQNAIKDEKQNMVQHIERQILRQFDLF